ARGLAGQLLDRRRDPGKTLLANRASERDREGGAVLHVSVCARVCGQQAQQFVVVNRDRFDAPLAELRIQRRESIGVQLLRARELVYLSLVAIPRDDRGGCG